MSKHTIINQLDNDMININNEYSNLLKSLVSEYGNIYVQKQNVKTTPIR